MLEWQACLKIFWEVETTRPHAPMISQKHLSLCASCLCEGLPVTVSNRRVATASNSQQQQVVASTLHAIQEAFHGQEMGSMEELRNTAPIPKPVLQVSCVHKYFINRVHSDMLMCWLAIDVCSLLICAHKMLHRIERPLLMCQLSALQQSFSVLC